MRVDDIALLLGLLMPMRIRPIYNQVIGDHRRPTALSGGSMVTIGLAFIRSPADHTQYKVAARVARHQPRLERVTGQVRVPSQFNDKRLSRWLWRLSQPEGWQRLAAALFWHQSVELYELATPGVGELHSADVDSTTAGGSHTPTKVG